ncbi:MAG: GntR family transcriptional regulator [Balneolaceae bacterium]|nr:GntR family transcriptional regulator [Balneolaceae bacterium]
MKIHTPETEKQSTRIMLEDNKPKHEQISDWLREKIGAGHFIVAGDRLPSENELGEKFDVSRVTVRHALKTLESEGIIYRRQGLGSFVDEAKISQPIVCLTDFEEDMKRAGLKGRSKIIAKEVVTGTRHITQKLDLEPDSKLVQLDRVRLANDKAIAFDKTCWLPPLYGQLFRGA